MSVKCILYYLLRYATFGIKLCIYVFHLVFKKERYLLLNVYCLFSQEGMDYGIQSTLYVLAIFEWSFSTIDLAERIGKGNVRSLINTNLCFCLGVEAFWAGKWFEFKAKDLNTLLRTIQTYGYSLFISFFWIPHVCQHSFINITPTKSRVNTQKDSCAKVISSSLEDCKENITCLFDKQHPTEIWSKIIISKYQKESK